MLSVIHTCYGIAKDTMVSKYTRFRELNKLVSTNHENPVTIFFVSLGMIAKMYWMNFVQWTDNSLERLDKNRVVISYIINGKLHKIIVRNKRGPENVQMVLDETSTDVTDEVLPYIGHNDSWELSPSFWKKEKLAFHLSTGEIKTFSENQTITV
jgi:hypothetical protein